jgi:RHS repeat-associated protein
MLLRTFRRWSPCIAHLALLLVLNLLLEGPAWAEQVRLRPRLVKLPESLLSQGQELLERAVEEAPRVPEGLEAQAPARKVQGRGGEPQKTSRPQETPKTRRSHAAPKAPLALASVALSIENQAVVPPLPSLPGMPAASSAPAAPQPAAAPSPSSSAEAVSLLSGWNLVSLPRQPDSVDPAAVLASISGSYQAVHAYDACSADPWRIYDPANPAGNSLTAIDHRMGLWVQATVAATLPVSGTEPAETAIRLCQGWNLIGYPLSQPRPVLAALSSIAGKFRRVYGWDPADQADPWEVFDVAVPAWANDLERMLPGRGYWIYATEDTTLVLSNAGLPPEVEITSPANAAAVTQPTDIVGTVSSNLLENWTLAYRLKGDTDAFATFATGNTPVTNGVLGKFDPTLLLNGLYEVELKATDFQGQSVSTSIDVAVEGNLKIGHFTLSFVDLEVPLAGLPIQVIRTYDSRDKRLGDFGVGWRVSVSNVRLQEDGPVGERWQGVRSGGSFPNYCVFPTREHQVTITLPDDRVLRFRPKLTPECQALAPPQVVTISYVPLPGTLGSLEMLDQNPQALVVGSFPGSAQLWDQDGVEIEDPGRYRLTTQDGRKFVIDQAAGLVNLTDLNGNTLTIGRNGITHSSGEGVTFERDAQGNITRVTDPAGESLTYSYNTSVDLVTVTDLEEATTRFTYNDHYLISIQDPLGRQPIRNEYDASGRLISTTDAFGKKINLTHSLAANREVVTDRLGHSRVLEYDARGNVIRETNALGKVTTRTFDTNDQLLSKTDPLGHTTRYTYDTSRNLTEVEDPLGNRTRYTYNMRGQLLTTTDPLGHTTRNTYDDSGNLLETEDPLGNVTSYTYDTRGNLLSQTDANGSITRFEYDARGNVVRKIDAAGNATTSTYDGNGNRLTDTTTRTLPGGQQTLTTTFAYDRLGRLVSIVQPDGSGTATVYNAIGQVAEAVDPLGRHTRFTYDELGRQTVTTYPDGTSDFRVYDAEGRLLAATDRGGRVITYLYDPLGRLVKTMFPDASSTTNTYDEAGRLVASTDARNTTTTYEYDATGRRTRMLDALGGQTVFEYDAAGKQVAVTDANRQTTSFVYDNLGRLVRTIFPDGTRRDVEYDDLGQRTAETDQDGKTTHFGYDVLGRLLAVTDALNQVTRYAYDEPGNRISQTDANGHITRFEYDALGRMTRRVLPDGAAEQLGYDAVGNLTSKRDFAGRTIGFTYDLANQLILKTYPGGASVAFTYTATGRRATMVDARGTTRYIYNERDRLVEMAYPDGRKLTYGWDSNGNRTELVTHVAGQVLQAQYTYDALNRLDTVIDPLGRVYDHGYDTNGNRTSITYPNGVQTSYTYDALNRLIQLTTRPTVGAVVQSYVYTLSAAGNRTKIEEGDGTTRSYGYDALYRLTNETVTHNGATVYTKAFGYDPVGNRLQEVHTDAAGTIATTNATYDTRDRQLARGGQIWTWDTNGNLSAKTGEATYVWGVDDRLQRVTRHDGTVVTHTYDADGVRVKTETRKPDGTTTAVDYMVDTSGLLGQVVAETTGGTLVAYYVRGDDLLAVIRPGATAETWASHFYHADGLGSIRALTGESGAVTDRYTFTAFGELLSHEGEDSNAYLFAGEMLDPNSGFYYNRARWMDPSVGRFASMDTFEGLEFEPGTLHKYLYATADPVNSIDPTGLQTVAEVAIVGAIITAIWANIAFPQTTILGRVKVTLMGAVFGALIFGGLALWAAGGSVVAAAGAAGAAGTAATGVATFGPSVAYDSEALFAGEVVLPEAANRVMLGHYYVYQGYIQGGQRFVSSSAGLRYLQALGLRLPGFSRTLQRLDSWEAIKQAIYEADQIVFNISKVQQYTQTGDVTWTWREAMLIYSDAELLAKTYFVTGGTF